MSPAPLTLDQIIALPKVVLHEHLDGGLRPSTVLELAAEIGHELPADNPADLARWFHESADSGSLVRYLETFVHTVAVMQSPENLTRVACEAVEDLAADGVVYAELRYAPELNTAGGLSIEQVVAAVQSGIEEATSRLPIVVRQILCSMRQTDRDLEAAEAVVDFLGYGVVGFDFAGPEKGFPASDHAAAIDVVRRASARLTIHAGEAYGLESIQDALLMGAERLGHGVRIVEDIAVLDSGEVELGRLASYVRDRQIPLEIAPTSNLQTGVAATIAEHPFGLLASEGFNVTINSDNRLMSNTSASQETWKLVEAFGYDLDDLEIFTLNAIHAAFLPLPDKVSLIEDVILPGYQAARG